MSYLVKSRHHIWYFRWSIKEQGKYHQIKYSLRTRCRLEALRDASTIALHLRANAPQSKRHVLSLLQEFRITNQNKEETLLDASQRIEQACADLSKKSIYDYISIWESFVASVIKRLDQSDTVISDITQADLEHWISEQTCKTVTLRKKIKILSSCFTRLSLKPNIEFKIRRVDLKSTSSDRRPFTAIELEYLLQYTSGYDDWRYYLPRLAVLTGCRLNELCQLTRSDVRQDEFGPFLSINSDGIRKKLKNASSKREIPITDELSTLICRLLDSHSREQLFDLPYSQYNGFAGKPSKYFSKILREYEVNEKIASGLSFHSTRHYFVTSLFNAGVKEEVIASLVGHSVGKTMSGKIYLGGINRRLKINALTSISLSLNQL